MAQKVGTNSVIDINDTRIRVSQDLSSPGHHFNVTFGDTWDFVLTRISLFATDPTTTQDALDFTLDPPSAGNPYVTRSALVSQIQSAKIAITVGPIGSGADYEGADETPFNDALAFLATRSVLGGWLLVKSGTYSMNATVTIPSGVRVMGVHPEVVTIASLGNFPVFHLTGSRSSLSRVTLEAASTTSQAAVKLSGTGGELSIVNVQSVGFLGVQVAGSQNRINWSRVESSAVGASGIILQTNYHTLNGVTFAGTLQGGALRFEGSNNGVFGSVFKSTLTGASYDIPSAINLYNKIVGNHFDSPVSLALSDDSGSSSVRYANTPNSFDLNENNFLEALRSYTGQTALDDMQLNPETNVFYDSGIISSVSLPLDHNLGPGFEPKPSTFFPFLPVVQFESVAGSGFFDNLMTESFIALSQNEVLGDLSVLSISATNRVRVAFLTFPTAPTTTYDSGIFTTAPTLPIAHGLVGIPTQVVIQWEKEAGSNEFVNLDTGSFLDVDGTFIYGNLDALLVNEDHKLRIAATVLAEGANFDTGIIGAAPVLPLAHGLGTLPAGLSVMHEMIAGSGIFTPIDSESFLSMDDTFIDGDLSALSISPTTRIRIIATVPPVTYGFDTGLVDTVPTLPLFYRILGNPLPAPPEFTLWYEADASSGRFREETPSASFLAINNDKVTGDLSPLVVSPTNRIRVTANHFNQATFDTGAMAHLPTLPINHGLGQMPTHVIVQYESEAYTGDFITLDSSSFLSFNATELKGDLAALVPGISLSNRVRIFASVGEAEVEFDTGIVSVAPTLPLAHGLGDYPARAILLYEAEASSGDFVNIPTTSFLTFSATDIDGDLSAFAVSATNRMRLILYSNASPRLSPVFGLEDHYSLLDKFLQHLYEERNIFVVSRIDPIFDSVGNVLSGHFTWDPTTSTLAMPNFEIAEPLFRAGRWHIDAQSKVILPGRVLYFEQDRLLAGNDRTVLADVLSLSIYLEEWHLHSERRVLAIALPGTTKLLWLDGFRVFGNGTDLVKFDVDGRLLGIHAYLGGGYPGATPLAPGFSGGATLPEQMSSRSAHLKMMFEASNLKFDKVGSRIRSEIDPAAPYLTTLAAGLPGDLTHTVEARGSTYGLVPAFGLYLYRRETADWALVAGNLGAAPFASLSMVGTRIALLEDAGRVVLYDPDSIGSITWTVILPTISTALTSTLPLPTAYTAGYISGGQADFLFQSQDWSYFSILNGTTVRFSNDAYYLEEAPRVFTEALGPVDEGGLASHHIKDTGYNTVRSPSTLHDLGSNGARSNLRGLPGGQASFAKLVLGKGVDRLGLASFPWGNLTNKTLSYDEGSGDFMGVWWDVGSDDYYIFGGDWSEPQLLSVQTSGDLLAADFTVHFWVVGAADQEVYALGARISNGAFAVTRGHFSLGEWVWSQTTLSLAGTTSGAVGVFDETTGNIHALVSNPARGSRATWWVRASGSGLWTQSTVTDVFSVAGDTVLPGGVATSWSYTYGLPLRGVGAADPLGVKFMVYDAARGGRPTIFMRDNGTSTISMLRLGTVAGPTVDLVVPTFAAPGFFEEARGAVWSERLEGTTWLASQSSNTAVTSFSLLSVAGTVTATDYGLGATSGDLTTESLSYPLFNLRPGHLARSHLSGFDAGPIVSETFWFTSEAGLVETNLTVNKVTGVGATYAPAVLNRVFPTTMSIPTFVGSSTFSAVVAHARDDLSLLIGSLAEPTLSTREYLGSGVLPGGLNGGMWTDTGEAAQNVGPNIWLGTSRGGWPWLLDVNFSNLQKELTDDPSTTRGDETIVGLEPANTRISFAENASQVAMVWRSASTDYLMFLLYDKALGTFVFERVGVDFVVGAPVIASNPHVVWVAGASKWYVVAQDDTGSGGQLVFFTREVTPVWTFDTIRDAGGTVTLGSMIADLGRNPGRPLVLEPSAAVLIAMEGGSLGDNLHLVHFTPGPSWSTVAFLPGGFVNPQLATSGSDFWAFGGKSLLTNAAIASSSVATSGWSLFSAPSSYIRSLEPKPYVSGTDILVASQLDSEGLAVINDEMCVWRFTNTGDVNVNGFTAKGRLQSSSWSGEEEESFTEVSWASDGSLLYGATRPGRTKPHWSLRSADWENLGEGFLGSGRGLTIGGRTFREQWVSDDAQDLIVEIGKPLRWENLPVGELNRNDYLSLRWPFAADVSASSLFSRGNPGGGFVADTGLASGRILFASDVREWPIILGNTNLNASGPGLLRHGALCLISAPEGETSSSYFDVTEIVPGGGNMLRVEARSRLSVEGTFRVKGYNGTNFNIVGPLTFDLESVPVGSSLVLGYAGGSLVMQATSALAGWVSANHSLLDYFVVLGRRDTQGFQMNPIFRGQSFSPHLTLASLEPRELSSSLQRWEYEWGSRASDSLEHLDWVTSVNGLVASVSKRTTTRGVQGIDFGVAGGQLLFRSSPGGGGYLVHKEGTQGPVGINKEKVNALVGLYGSVVN